MSFRIILLLLMLFIPLANLKAQPNGLEKAFSLIELLSSEGVNVSRQVDLLNSALSLYRQGKMEEADNLVNTALSELTSLQKELPNYKFWRNFWLFLRISAIAIVPPAFYYIFPRIYAYLWYRARRKWVVRRIR
ncbi:MAG: hypothetical protein DSO07_01895 [Thermoproteota archaeon]|nr:MAG: hypothetical protein DSO07_01895 [Candidatus Korarchaeota archaeon]